MFLDNGGSVGYGFIFLATLLEFLGLPAPGGLLVALAAASLAHGKLGLIPLIGVAAIAAAIGDIPWYFLGRFGGMRLLRGYCRFTLGSRFCVKHTESFFLRYDSLSLVVSKLISGVRAFATPIAGIQGDSFGRFLLLDLLGSFFWAAFFAMTGWAFGSTLSFRIGNRVIVAVTAVPFLVFFIPSYQACREGACGRCASLTGGFRADTSASHGVGVLIGKRGQ